MSQRFLSSGFTLVETIIVITVCGILTGLLFGPLDDLYVANTQSLSSIVQTTDVKAALRQMEKTVALGFGVSAQSYTDVTGQTWHWDDTAANMTGNPLIVGSYTSEVNASGNRVLAAIDSSQCGYLPILQSYTTMFFVKDNVLYRRTAKPVPVTTCDHRAIEQKNSCPSPATTVGCDLNDAVLLRNVTGFDIQYYTSSDSATAVTPVSANFALYKTVVIKITTTVGAGSNAKTASSSLRMSFVNG